MKKPDEVMYILWKHRGWSQREVATLFGCDVATVCRMIQPVRWKRWEIVLSPFELKRMYREMGSIAKVAESLLCSKSTIHKKLVKYGIKRNPPSVHL